MRVSENTKRVRWMGKKRGSRTEFQVTPTLRGWREKRISEEE